MQNNTTILVSALLFVTACGTGGDGSIESPPELAAPAGAIFELALWPGEGVPEFVATGAPLVLRDSPRDDAVVYDTVIPHRGEPIGYDATSYQTISAVDIVVRRTDSIAGRDFGAVTRISLEEYQDPSISEVVVAVEPGSSLQLLQHRAEGSCLVRLENRVIDAATCPVFDTESFAASGQPETRWWIHANVAASAGWVEFTDFVLELSGRRF